MNNLKNISIEELQECAEALRKQLFIVRANPKHYTRVSNWLWLVEKEITDRTVQDETDILEGLN